MTFTYESPSGSELEEVRFLIGDTNSVDQQLSDEEINYLLADEPTVRKAAVAAAKALAAKYARLVDKSVDGLRLSYSQRSKHYMDIAKELSKKDASKRTGIFAGGISIAQKETVDSDTDRVPPSFARGQFDYPGTDDYSDDLETD